jgi:MFS transporter, DHA1 family, multidrug resistance protein
MSPTVGWLIAFRFLQGTGAAMGVIPRAIIRDLHTGAEATRLMSLVMLVFSVSPILAPLTGSALIVPLAGARLFVAVGIAALIALAAATTPRSREPADRDRLAAEFRIVSLFDRRVEGIHVDVDDLAAGRRCGVRI